MTSSQKKPPSIACWILSKLKYYEEHFAIVDALDLEYQEIREESGTIKSRIWYWFSTLEILCQFSYWSIFWSFIMFKNYFKLTCRTLLNQKVYSFINITGLAVGLACVILILLFVFYELSYESHNPNINQVYRVYVEHKGLDREYIVGATPVPLAETLHEEILEIADFTRSYSLPRLLINYEDKKFKESNIIAADPGVFDILGFQLISGNKETALSEGYSVVITEQIADKYFGDENPIGETLILDNSISLLVRGVMQNHPANTDFNPRMLISFTTIKDLFGRDFSTNWLSQILHSYIRVPEGYSPELLESKIETSFSKYRAKENDDRVLKLERLSRMHLYSIFGNRNIRYIYIFLAVAGLILLTACINFMNLATARSANRAREIGMRKVVGAQRKQIIRQFIGESYIYAVLSLLLGLLIAAVLIPQLRKITGQALTFQQIGQMPVLVSIVFVLIVVGFLSGSYPALYLSAFRPVKVLKDSSGIGTKGTFFRKILVVSQFTISIILLISTFIFTRQLHYMQNMPLGFKQDQIVIIRNEGRGDIEPFKELLKDNLNVLSICGSYMLPHRIGMYNEVTWEGAIDNEVIAINHNTVDYDFLDTFEIPLLAGRDFSRDFPADIRSGADPANAGGILLNEEAVKRMGWTDAVGKKVIQVFGEQRITFTVIGVVKDFFYSSLRNPITPLKIFLGTDRLNLISIKIQNQDMQNTLKAIEDAWNQFNPEFPFEYYFYDSVFAQLYQQEQNLRILFSYFSVLAIFIACLGLFGLASFAAAKRSKEISIRKILGASNEGVVYLISKEFTKWVIIANIIAWPIAFYAMNKWLNGFANRIDVLDNWVVFIVSGGIALIIALLTVSYHAIKIAWSNPVDSLRYE